MSKKKQQEPPLHCQRRFKSLRSSLGERSLRLLETDQKSAKVTVAFLPDSRLTGHYGRRNPRV